MKFKLQVNNIAVSFRQLSLYSFLARDKYGI